jgi:hypothetical protein
MVVEYDPLELPCQYLSFYWYSVLALREKVRDPKSPR